METPFTVTSRNFKITWNLKQIFIIRSFVIKTREGEEIVLFITLVPKDL